MTCNLHLSELTNLPVKFLVVVAAAVLRVYVCVWGGRRVVSPGRRITESGSVEFENFY